MKLSKGLNGGTLKSQQKGDKALPNSGRPKGSKNKSTLLKELLEFISDNKNKDALDKMGFGSGRQFITNAKKAGIDPLMAKQVQLAFGKQEMYNKETGDTVEVDINPDIQRKAVADLQDRVEGKPIAKTLTADVDKEDVLDEILDELSE